MLCVVGVYMSISIYKIPIKNCNMCFVNCVSVVDVLINWIGFGSRLSKRWSLKKPTENFKKLKII